MGPEGEGTMAEAQQVAAGRRLASTGEGRRVREAARLSLADMARAVVAEGAPPTTGKATVAHWECAGDPGHPGGSLPRAAAAAAYYRVVARLRAGLGDSR